MADHLIILLFEVVSHRYGGASLALLELASGRTHVESNIGYLVSLMVTIASHDDGSFEFIDNCFLKFCLLWSFVSVPRAPLCEPVHLLIDELVTMIDREILRYVVNDEIQTPLEYPR